MGKIVFYMVTHEHCMYNFDFEHTVEEKLRLMVWFDLTIQPSLFCIITKLFYFMILSFKSYQVSWQF